MPYGEGERTGSEPDERSRGSDGEERRSGEGKEALGEAPEGDSEGGSPGTMGQEGAFVYLIETAGGVVIIGFSSTNPSVRRLRLRRPQMPNERPRPHFLRSSVSASPPHP